MTGQRGEGAARRMADDFPLLWDLAKDHDNAEKLGAASTALSQEADRAMREIWDARQFLAATRPPREEER